MLKTQQCGSSNSVCINHFASDDYSITSNGKIYLKPGAIPSVFDTYMIEVNENDELPVASHFDESQETACSNATRTELQELKSKNAKLTEIITQIRWNHKRENKVLINHLKRLNLKQSKEILALKREVAHCKNENEKLEIRLSEFYGIFGKPDVNIFHYLMNS